MFHPNKSPLKISEKRERGHIQGLPKFFGYPLLSQERGKLQISNLASTFRGSIRIKRMKNLGEKGEWAYPGAAQNFRVPPIISGTGKATDFKFGQHIHRVHPNKSPLKISEKRERWRIQGLSKLFGYPLLSQERVKLQISNIASTFKGSIGIKAHEKFWKKGSVGVSSDCPKFSGTPYYLRNG